MTKEFLDYLEDIIEAMEDAMKFTQNMGYEEFVKDKKSAYATTRALEIIGEAVKNIVSSILCLGKSFLLIFSNIGFALMNPLWTLLLHFPFSSVEIR